jgi:hypothetical protein
MKPVNTNFNHFLWSEYVSTMTFSLYTEIQQAYLSPLTKKVVKIREIKFDIKIEFLTTKGTTHQ